MKDNQKKDLQMLNVQDHIHQLLTRDDAEKLFNKEKMQSID